MEYIFFLFRKISTIFKKNPHRTPYDQNSTVGHVFTHIIQTSGISTLSAYMCAITMTFFGVCSYIEALFTDIAEQHQKFESEFLLKSAFPSRKKLEASTKLRNDLIELIELHNVILK